MRFLFLMFVMVSVAAAQTNQVDDVLKVRVTGDGVSLRPRPELSGYPLDRAMSGDELIFLDETNGWVGVQAPDTIEVWVAGEYVQDGVVTPKRLNVRSGPGLNYPVVAIVSQGDLLQVKREFNSWTAVAPPESCIVWISADYVEKIAPPVEMAETAPIEVVEVTPEEETEVDPIEEQVVQVAEEEELPSLMLVLDESKEQEVFVELPGVLRRANPGLYKLVLVEGDWEEAICLVRGRKSQMEDCLGRTILIKGPRFWVKDLVLPVVQPDTIVMDPILENE